MTQNNKHPAMIVYEDAHLNAEPPLDLLCSSFITPTELFFARNHAPIPTLDPTTYRLNINGLVQKSLTLTLEDVMRYPKQVITATLMCAGNRRLALHQREPIKDELPWDNSAISTATWGGLWLRDLLMEAGLEDGAAHIAFLGADEVPKGESSFHFGGSVPLEKMEDMLLAYEMNGEPLRSEHGYPLRVIAPGTIGARSVKWLTDISVQTAPSDNHYQAEAYKLFPPDVREETADWDSAPMLGGLIVNSVICCPQEGEKLAAGLTKIKGYALAADNARVERVELSSNGGATWHDAALVGEDHPYAWRLWESELMLTSGTHELVVRATDSAGNTQPESIADVWNFKGYMNNSWHRVWVEVS